MDRSKIFRFFYCFILIVFIASSTILIIRLVELQRGKEFYEQIGGTGDAISPVPPNPESSMSIKYEEADEQEHETATTELPELSMHLLQFADDYPGTVMWLQITNTSVDYPVMLGADNQFYLNHLPDGSKNALGSLFLDYRTNEDSNHLIIYGHNGSGGKMFGLLKRYEAQDYWGEHPALTVATSDSVYICPIFSVRRVEADSDAYRLEFEDNDDLICYMNWAASESLYQIDIDFADAAKVLTLSTCTGWHNQRFIVQAVLQEGQEILP